LHSVRAEFVTARSKDYPESYTRGGVSNCGEGGMVAKEKRPSREKTEAGAEGQFLSFSFGGGGPPSGLDKRGWH